MNQLRSHVHNQSNRDKRGIEFQQRDSKRQKEDEDKGASTSNPLSEAKNEKDGSSVPIPFLPSQVLEQLFLCLSVDEHRNIRATCRFWREYCCISPIVKHQKFVFRGNSDKTDPSVIRFAMLDSGFEILNADFQNVSRLSLLGDMWEECGPKVNSLSFRECLLNGKILFNILRSCVNLTSLTIYGYLENFAFVDPLNKLIGEKVQLTRLHTLALLPGPIIDQKIQKKILSVFPNVKHVTLSLKLNHKTIEDPRWLSQIRSLSMQLHPLLSTYLQKKTLMIPIGQFRLEKFETELKSVRSESARKVQLFNFLRNQKELRILNLRINDSNSCFKEIIFEILRNCPALKEFRIGEQNLLICEKKIIVSIEELTELLLLMQKLECFVTSSFHFCVSHVPRSVGPTLPLRTLSLRCMDSNESVIVYILKHCPELEHLHIFDAKEIILKEIFRSLLNLKTLVLELDDNCQRVAFASDDSQFSVERLQKLEQLALMFWTKEAMLTFMGKFRLPNLKHLAFSVPDHVGFFSRLAEFSRKIPKLESLAFFSYHCLVIEDIEFICTCFPKLRYLWATHILYPCFERPSELESVFRKFPQLLYISDQTRVFFPDPFAEGKRRMLSCLLHKLDFPSKCHMQLKSADTFSIFLFDNSWILNNFFWKYRY